MSSKERWLKKFSALCACNSHMSHSSAKTATNSSVNIARSSFFSPTAKTSPNWSHTTRMSTPTQKHSNFRKTGSQRCHQGREKPTLLKCRLDNKLNSNLEDKELHQDTTFAAHTVRLEVTFCKMLTRFSRTALTSANSLINVTRTIDMVRSYGKP